MSIMPNALQTPEARDWLVDLIEENCPHEADQHAEGTCEVCDYAFALVAGLDAWMNDDLSCSHDWLLRPESDTEVCLICGEES